MVVTGVAATVHILNKIKKDNRNRAAAKLLLPPLRWW